ncbi:unnamed protein product [Cochlearia groenlandica]
MDPQSSSATEEDGEWEICYDKDFIYKRRKRSRISTAEIDDAGAVEASKPVDPERNRRIRKKKILLKLKRKYEKEIGQWENLSNIMNARQEEAARFQQQQREEEEMLNANETPSFPVCQAAGENSGEVASAMLDELNSMAEAREAVIDDVSNLCEVADNICCTMEDEEERNKTFFDLIVWSSPNSLMESLCSD